MSLQRVKKGDTVMVMRGRERGKSGTVLGLLTSRNRVLVENVNMIKRHRKPQGQEPGGIIEREAGIHLSNVMPVCGECDKPARVGHARLDDGTPVRVCRRCGTHFES